MARYLLLIYEDESAWAARSPDEVQEIMGDYYAFGESIRDTMRGGEALLPTATARTVGVRDGKQVITDGPFAETKEQVGGFYLVECDSLEQAEQTAAKIPSAKWGHIEVRECQVFPEQPEHP
jgi:hypothetical protein